MELFKVNSVDYTPHLKLTDYQIGRTDEIETWVDANHVTHGNVVRRRISGSLKMVLESSDYNSFLTNMNAVRQSDGSYSLYLHDNTGSTNTVTENVYCYVTIQTKVVYGTKNYAYLPTATEVILSFEER